MPHLDPPSLPAPTPKTSAAAMKRRRTWRARIEAAAIVFISLGIVGFVLAVAAR